MKQITVYEASDGSRWDDEGGATRREALVARCVDAESVLPKTVLGHGEFCTHNPEQAKAFHVAVVEIARHEHPGTMAGYPANNLAVSPTSLIGRIVSDTGGPLNRLWHRLMCLDTESGREFDQPYFRNHPHEARERV